MQHILPSLPIQAVLPELKKHLAKHRSVILAAEPGSGKTTIAPLALVNEPWLQGQKIIILEPRRLAARMAAKRMSDLIGDSLGSLVGYRIRFDNKVSAQTKIEVVTEGVFTRMIQHNPELTGIGLVIFDEFHERSLMTDLALALCFDAQELRDDLKTLLMSATMDTSRISKLLEDAPVITGKGRCFPVTVHYLTRPSNESLISRTARAIQRAITEHSGDILVFLPGAGEIKAVQNHVKGDILCLTLYGNLPQKKQDLVFTPTDKRRLILSTPIAETSLTLEGVSVVIDSGLVKIPRFTPENGLTTLHTISISKASAEQRAGRAGRLGPGTCYRLWTKGEHHSKAAYLAPEIIDADLTPLLLQIIQWGVSDPCNLKWLDPPRTGQVNQARDLLTKLGAIDEKGLLTDTGRQICLLPLHPRLALMLLRARKQGHGSLACWLAALLQNRDLFRGNNQEQSVDIEERLEILHLFEQKKMTMIQARGADPSLCRRILQEAHQYQRILNVKGPALDFQESGNLLALAYPDRIAHKRPGSNQHLLASGRGAILPTGDHMQQAEFLVAANLDGGRQQGRIFLGASLTRQEILTNHSHLLKKQEKVAWNKTKVEANSILYLGSLELAREPLRQVDPYAMSRCLLQGIQQTGINCLGWTNKSRELQARMQSAHYYAPDTWPDVSDTNLVKDLSWLEPYLDSIISLQQLKRIDLSSALLALLSWKDQQKLDKHFPTHFKVPSGSNKKIQYQPGEEPIIAVRVQEMFGLANTPQIADGHVKMKLHLLSPAQRPIQITQDLAGFWNNTYPQVKKELMGRYPKHHWPDDPWTATPTARAKRKRR